MRIATLVMGLLFLVPITVQSVVIYAAGNMASQRSAAEGGLMGLLISLLWLVGLAFVWGIPAASMAAFVVAAILTFVVAATTHFGDMNIWGVVSLLFAGMSLLSLREIRGKKRVNGQPSGEPV